MIAFPSAPVTTRRSGCGLAPETDHLSGAPATGVPTASPAFAVTAPVAPAYGVWGWSARMLSGVWRPKRQTISYRADAPRGPEQSEHVVVHAGPVAVPGGDRHRCEVAGQRGAADLLEAPAI